MRYVDLHCDTLTAAYDRGVTIKDSRLQAGAEKLNKSECAAQCFAIFTQGDGAALAFKNYLEYYLKCVAKGELKPVLCANDLRTCIEGGGTGSILTVENLGFLSDLSQLQELKDVGVKMASLVWNYENSLAYPNRRTCPPPAQGGGVRGDREARELKPLGLQTVEMLDSLKIIVDISHLSDGGAARILNGRKIPIVASHSNAEKVCGVSRNLTDLQIKKIADCGGVIGVNFFKNFLGEGDTFACVLKHIRHIISVGGEDVIAFGSDFDGIPATPDLEDCTKMPALISYLESGGISGRVLEKLCYKNFYRVFSEVCG